jgi:hypothetical protein
MFILTILFNPNSSFTDMTDTQRQKGKKPKPKTNPGRPEVNEYPRQGNEDPKFGLVGEEGVENIVTEKEEALGKDIKSRIQKGRQEGVTFDPSRSDE